MENKLHRTKVVDEHLSYLYVQFGITIQISKIAPEIVIRSLVYTTNATKLQITSVLISHINTELNDIKELSYFVEAIYPLCVSSTTPKEDLNNLALT